AHKRLALSLSILRSQVGKWVICKCTFVYHPAQKTVDKAGMMRDRLERPHLDSIIEPMPYGFLRNRFILHPFGDESLESIQDAAVDLGRYRAAQMQLLDVILWCCSLRRGGGLHAFTSVGISIATARKSSVASFC